MTSVVSVASSVASSGTFSSVVLAALRRDDDQRGLTGRANVVSACQSAGLNVALRTVVSSGTQTRLTGITKHGLSVPVSMTSVVSECF